MAGIRKAPKLRTKTSNGCDYFVADVYRPDTGKRTTINFGPTSQNPGDVYQTFGAWLKLFESQPSKVLAFKSPTDAVNAMSGRAPATTLGGLIDQYRSWAEQEFRYTRTGGQSPSWIMLVSALKFLTPYRTRAVSEFGADELRDLRDAMLAHRYAAGSKSKGLTRTAINDRLAQLRRMFSWAVGRELMSVAQERQLRETRTLRYLDAGTIEAKFRRPVTAAEFAKVLAHLNPEVADMAQVMWLAVCRPDEVASMRPIDFIRDQDDAWLYVPGRDSGPLGKHKTAARNRVRVIPITPALQAILKPRIDTAADEHETLFSPAKARRWMQDRRFAKRSTPLNQGNRPGTHRTPEPKRKPGGKYGHRAFSTALKRACRKAKVEEFSAYDLRRTTATRVDAILGRDAARRLLGHTKVTTTNLYMLEEAQRAIEAASQLDGKLDVPNAKAAA